MKEDEKLIPNFTQVPNLLLDEWMARLSDVELRVLLVVVRQTIGWVEDAKTGRRKTEDWMTNSQLAAKTGKSGFRVSLAVKSLIERYGLIEAVNARGKLLDSTMKRQSVGTGGKIFYRLSLRNPEMTLFDAVKKRPSTKSVRSPEPSTIRGSTKSGTTKETDFTKETNTPAPKTAAGDPSSQKEAFTPLGADVLKAFEAVDPKNKTYYNRRPQREACEFLIAEYGFERVVKVIGGLTKTNTIPFFPSITTPLQLKEKWVPLHDAAARYRAEHQSKKPLVV